MIKILFVLEEEDGIDFRAYALQISSSSKNEPPAVKLTQIADSNGEHIGSNASGHASPPETRDNYGSYMRQIKRPLETRQIFMN